MSPCPQASIGLPVRDGRHPGRRADVRPKISLLHATYRREGGPLEVKASWLEHAERPDLVDYIFAVDADDESTLRQTEGHARVVLPPVDGWVTPVRKWNAAARMASGDLLMVIADDLFPPERWDTTLAEIIEPLSPARTSFAVKITDSPWEGDGLLRHPVISRAFYQRHGLFLDDYRGVYADNDLTLRAAWRAVILNGILLICEHRHPPGDEWALLTESRRRVHDPSEYLYGKTIYVASSSLRQRTAAVRIFSREPRTGLRRIWCCERGHRSTGYCKCGGRRTGCGQQPLFYLRKRPPEAVASHRAGAHTAAIASDWSFTAVRLACR